jgi:hypothetical protein
MQCLFELDALMVMVDGFDGLLKADSNDEADDDGGDVNEKVAPGMRRVFGWVEVEHETPEKEGCRYHHTSQIWRQRASAVIIRYSPSQCLLSQSLSAASRKL